MSWEYSENILVQNSAGNILQDKAYLRLLPKLMSGELEV